MSCQSNIEPVGYCFADQTTHGVSAHNFQLALCNT